jgi:ABC-2 type transport system permease protein
MNKIFRLTYRILRAGLDINSATFLILMPVGYLVLMGLMMRSIVPYFYYDNLKLSYITFLSPGIVADQVLIGGSFAGWILWADKRVGMLEQIFSMPYTRFQYLLCMLLAMMILTFLGALLIVAISIPFIAIHITIYGFLLSLVYLMLGTFTFGSIMLALGASIKSNQMFNMVSNFLFFVLTFASSIFYPITSYTPYVLQVIAELNPLTYVGNGIRNSFLNIININDLYWLVILSITSIVCMIIGTYSYNKIKFTAVV